MKKAICISFAFLCITTSADARSRHHRHATQQPAAQQTVKLFNPFLQAQPKAKAAGKVYRSKGKRHHYARAGKRSRHVQHHHHKWSGHSGNVCSKTGACATVAEEHVDKFQCLVNHLDNTGYRIYYMGGYRNTKIAGTNTTSQHAYGRALDVNQNARNICKGGCPHVASVAKSCGLFDGGQWGYPDAGHFEVRG